MKMKLVAIGLLFTGIVSVPSFAQQKGARTASNGQSWQQKAQPIVEKEQNGLVNWGDQYVEAVGQSVIDTIRFKNPAQARAMAIRGATVVAQRNLLEIIKGVNIVGETTVEDMITTKDVVQSRVEGVIKGAVPVGKPRIADGLVEVTLRVPLYANNGIAPLVVEPAKEIIDSIAKASPNARLDDNTTTASVSGTVTPEIQEKLKNVVFNLNGQKLNPSMFPMMVDENNNMIFDFTKIYDPNKGQFPKYLQLGKDVLNAVGFKKGAEVIDVVQNSEGKLVVKSEDVKKSGWDKVFNVLGKIAKFVLMFI